MKETVFYQPAQKNIGLLLSNYDSKWSDFRVCVKTELSHLLPSIENIFLEGASLSLFKGKYSRSYIIWAIAKHFKIPFNKAVILSASVELLHEASLIHDDIQDGQKISRGLPTAHMTIGQNQAINLGSYLAAKSREVIFQSTIFSDREKLQIYSALDSTLISMIAGQNLEFTPLSEQVFCEINYWRCVGGKTCSIITSVLEAFQIQSKDIESALCLLGETYQLNNDLEDFIKGSGSIDYKNKIETLPNIKLFQMRNCNKSNFWNNTPSQEEILKIKKNISYILDLKIQKLDDTLSNPESEELRFDLLKVLKAVRKPVLEDV